MSCPPPSQIDANKAGRVFFAPPLAETGPSLYDAISLSNRGKLVSETTFEQVPFGGGDFAENPENRCPCILLLDTSGSMQGQPINELNAGLQQFREDLLSDPMAAKRVEVAVVTFGPVNVVSDFVSPDAFVVPHLVAASDTPMGAAIERALEMTAARKAQYLQFGVSYYRPWIFLITDGGPTDEWHRAAAQVKEGEAARKFQFYAVGVQGANIEILKQISVRQPLSLKALQFRELFSWLSNSLSAVSQSQLGEAVPLVNPATPEGWATV